jgi:hypothetical protein
MMLLAASRQGSDVQIARREVPDVVCRALQGIDTHEASLDLVVEIARFGRDRQRAAFRPHKETKTDRILQVGDQLADRGLRQVHHLRRLRHRAGQHDRAEGFELAKIHGSYPLVIGPGYDPNEKRRSGE